MPHLLADGNGEEATSNIGSLPHLNPASLTAQSILLFRRRVGAAFVGHPQLPLQAGPAARTALHLLGQARLGAVLLQGGPPRGERAHPQEPAGK